MEESKNKNSQLNDYLKYSALAFQFFVAIGLGVWAGWKLDSWLGLKFPAFTVALSCLALIGSLIMVIRSLPNK